MSDNKKKLHWGLLLLALFFIVVGGYVLLFGLPADTPNPTGRPFRVTGIPARLFALLIFIAGLAIAKAEIKRSKSGRD